MYFKRQVDFGTASVTAWVMCREIFYVVVFGGAFGKGITP